MADPEHIERLKAGVQTWNAWRIENHIVRPDFSDANFGGADLGGAVHLEADLSKAVLRGAFLIRANFSGAELHGAQLGWANFRGADLDGANFGGAELFSTIFADTNLSQVEGLYEIRHLGPSIIDYRTLRRSGRLPDVFLRGCGLPNRLIEYLPSLLDDPIIRFYSCFISYSHADKSFARRLHDQLQGRPGAGRIPASGCDQ